MEKNLSRFLLVLSSVPIMVILLRSFQHKEYKNNKKGNMLCCRPFRCSCDWSTAVCVGVFIGFFFSINTPHASNSCCPTLGFWHMWVFSMLVIFCVFIVVLIVVAMPNKYLFYLSAPGLLHHSCSVWYIPAITRYFFDLVQSGFYARFRKFLTMNVCMLTLALLCVEFLLLCWCIMLVLLALTWCMHFPLAYSGVWSYHFVLCSYYRWHFNATPIPHPPSFLGLFILGCVTYVCTKYAVLFYGLVRLWFGVPLEFICMPHRSSQQMLYLKYPIVWGK